MADRMTEDMDDANNIGRENGNVSEIMLRLEDRVFQTAVDPDFADKIDGIVMKPPSWWRWLKYLPRRLFLSVADSFKK